MAYFWGPRKLKHQVIIKYDTLTTLKLDPYICKIRNKVSKKSITKSQFARVENIAMKPAGFKTQGSRKEIIHIVTIQWSSNCHLLNYVQKVSAHKVNNSNSIFLTFNLHMRSISCSLSRFDSSINSKRFVCHLKQQCNLHHFQGSIQFNTNTPIPNYKHSKKWAKPWKSNLALKHKIVEWNTKLTVMSLSII